MMEQYDGNHYFFDADYFERGIESGKSCYQVYRWIPELTIPMAMTIIDYLGIKRGHKVLDYGCSKGFLVKALRLLYRDAWGLDVSRYAIRNADPYVQGYCAVAGDGAYELFPEEFDFCIAKDVFEHIFEGDLDKVLKEKIKAKTLFAVIPLGEDGKYRAPANNFDKSHVICQPESWWIKKFGECGWILVDSTLSIRGIKDSYQESYPDAHGFFTLRR
jgi:SAM-dependent methyltransferase